MGWQTVGIFLLLFLFAHGLNAQEQTSEVSKGGTKASPPIKKEESTEEKEEKKKEEKPSSSGQDQTSEVSKGGTKATPPIKKEESAEEKKEKKEEPTHKLTGAVTFLSDYRDRGISQTMRQPSIQGELKYTHKSGFYYNMTGYNVDGTGHFLNNTSLEWDHYLGFRHTLFNTSAKYDVGFLFYYYPGGRAKVPANARYDYIEYYLGVTYKNLEVKLSISIDDYSGVNSGNPPMNWDIGRPIRPNGSSYGSPYLEVNYDYSIREKWKATFHIGYQRVINYPELNFLDWLVTLSHEFEWFELSVSYVQSNGRRAFYNVPDNAFHPKRKDLGGPGVVIGVDKTF